MTDQTRKLAIHAGIGASWVNIEADTASIFAKRIRRIRKRGKLRLSTNGIVSWAEYYRP